MKLETMPIFKIGRISIDSEMHWECAVYRNKTVIMIQISLGRYPILQCWFTRGRPSTNNFNKMAISKNLDRNVHQ